MSNRNEIVPALRFAAKFIGIVAIIILVTWSVGMAFALAKPLGFVSLVCVAGYLAWTAHHWVKWLPGLLPFGILNSALLMTKGYPANPGVLVSTEVALLLMAFYAVGTIISNRYDVNRLSVFDRCAFVVYLTMMIAPGFISPTNPVSINSTVALLASTGMVVLVVAYGSHRTQSKLTSAKPDGVASH